MVRGKSIHAVCCEDNYFTKGKCKLFNSLFHSVYLAFSIRLFLLPIFLPSVICGMYVTGINAVSWHFAWQTFASLGLFMFALIACVLQL